MEYKVKSYTRRTKSGKTVTVKAHIRKGKGGSNERERARRAMEKRVGKEFMATRALKDSEEDSRRQHTFDTLLRGELGLSKNEKLPSRTDKRRIEASKKVRKWIRGYLDQ